MNNLFAFLPMQESNDLLDDPTSLRQRMATDGYLYFRQVIEREKVKELRRDMLRALAGLGWVEPPSVPVSDRCTVAPLREEDPEFRVGYREIQKLESFHALAHDDQLMAVMRAALGDSAFPHPLKIARLAFPDHFEVSTPPHQDFPNNQGTPNLTASWIPVGDLTPEYGGLAVLRGSHRWGLLPMAGHIGAGNRCAVIPPDMAEQCRWVTTEFRMGDVLLFPSLTVHAALHNASATSMRLSVDFRYQLEGEALTPGCLEPHFQQITWPEIYDGWSSDQYKYYWRGLDYRVEDWTRLPIEGEVAPADVDIEDITALLRPDEVGQILRFKSRVEARFARRAARLAADRPMADQVPE